MKANNGLEFLSNANNDDLCILVDYLTKDKNGDVRITENLTSTDEYAMCYPNKLSSMTDLIIDELQCYGGNTFMNIVRGHGVEYKDILIDVAKKMKVNFNKKSSIEVIEMNLLQTIFLNSLDNMSEAELKELMGGLNVRTICVGKQAMVAALQIAIKRGGFASYKIAVIVANSIARALLGRGLSFAANYTLGGCNLNCVSKA